LVLIVVLSFIAALLVSIPLTLTALGVRVNRNNTAADSADVPTTPCGSGSACFWTTLTLRLLFTSGTVFLPAIINAITLGLVGPLLLPRQVSENEIAKHSGAVVMVVIAGSVAWFARFPDIMFYLPAATALISMACASLIPSRQIQIDRARGFALRVSETLDGSVAGDDGPTGEDDLLEPLLAADSHGSLGDDATRLVGDGATPRFGSADLLQKEQEHEKQQQEEEGKKREKRVAVSYIDVLRDWRVVLFVALGMLYHLGNASVLPLLTARLLIGSAASDDPLKGFPFAAGCILFAQLTSIPVAHFAGRWTQRFGRKTVFLLGLLAMPTRCILILLLSLFTDNEYGLMATQVRTVC